MAEKHRRIFPRRSVGHFLAVHVISGTIRISVDHFQNILQNSLVKAPEHFLVVFVCFCENQRVGVDF